MRQRRRVASTFVVAALVLLAAGLASEMAVAAAIDPAMSAIGFNIRTRWGQVLEGRFPAYSGDIESLANGRQRVRLQLDATQVEIVGNAGYSRFTRGSGFFDAEHWPTVAFESDPFGAALTRSGGELAGMLEIRGVRRREVFTIEPATCDDPGIGCDVVASGSVDRNEYGVDRWGFAIGSRVVFKLRVRVTSGSPESGPAASPASSPA